MVEPLHRRDGGPDVQDLVDSSDVVDDPEALRARLRTSGYVLLRGLLPRSDVLATGRAVLGALREVGWACESSLPVWPPVPEEDYRDLGVALQRLEAVHQLAFHPRLRHAVNGLLPRCFGHPARVVRTVWPHRVWNDEVEFVHQDFSVFGVPDMLTTWFPLGDVPLEMGPLRVLEGSHQQGMIGRLWRGEETTVNSDDPRWSTGDFAAGDVIVFHCLTVHAGMRNTTDQFRLSVDARWQSMDYPVPEIELWPHVDMHFKVTPTAATHPGWDEISAEWSSREAIEVPPGLTVVNHAGADVTFEHLRPSRFVG